MERWQLRQFQALPLDVKIAKTKQRIREWVEYFGLEATYVAFSGGKDSTALLHIARSLYPEIHAAYSDTGLEFPEIREFVKSVENVTWIKPKLSFRQVLDKCGYPIISKETAERLGRLQKPTCSQRAKERLLEGIMADGRKTQFVLAKKWRFLIDAPFMIGSGCCHHMKISPFKKYEKETGRIAPILGTMTAESKLREQKWLKNGCNAFNAKRTVSAPISFWTDADVWSYLRQYDVPYSKIYDMGYHRTGCVFCALGAQMDKSPNRFQRLKVTHPQIWYYCMKPKEDGGLGMREILEYVGIPFE